MLKYSFWQKCSKFLKFVRLFIYLFFLILVIISVYNSVQQCFQYKVAISFSSSLMESITFPKVSLCSANKISKKMIDKWVINTSLNVQNGNSLNNLTYLSKYFGRIYDHELHYGFDFLKLERFLVDHKIMGLEQNASNNIQSLMMKLSVPCEELLNICYWRKVQYDCTKLFSNVATSMGSCCNLNNSYLPATKTMYPKLSIDSGLSVEVKHDIDDYFYMTAPTAGLNVYIFQPSDYQDPVSVGVVDMFAAVGEETNINLKPHIMTTTSNIRRTQIKTRACLFNDERSTIFGNYSFSNCLMECRLRALFTLCKCKLFSQSTFINVKFCTFSDIPCLYKYREKWFRLHPMNVNSDQLEQERQNSMNCEECYPDCTRQYYVASVNSVSLITNDTTSIVNIYFGTEKTIIVKRQLMMMWFEVVATIGGILGIYFGVSYISLLQITYFIILTYYKKIFN